MNHLFAGIALAALCLFGGCSHEDASAGFRPGDKVRIVATTGMVADVARAVGGESAQVTALMRAGVDPHLYRASPQDVDLLETADLILYNGKGLEGKMGDLFVKLAGRRPVVAVSDGIADDRLLDDGQHYDPHIWFDCELWSETPAAVAEALAKIDPDRAASYRANAAAYKKQILVLHDEVKTGVGTIPKGQRVLVTSHDAFRYFGRAYGVEVHGLQGISTDSEAGVMDMQRVVKLVVGRKIKAIFVETSVARRTIEAVQSASREKGHEVLIGGTLYSDAMGERPPDDTYPGMVRANLRVLVEALR